ncbi:MAG: hypothetical protein MZV64_37645 [Ignavibacteriales bacterium]|nr:hypothetical protein [Ignavibacteriales bacterium]
MISKIWTGIDSYGYSSAVVGSYCYVASEKSGVRAINISNPAVPLEDGYYDFIAQSRGVTADGKYVYVAEKADGLTIYSNDLVTSIADENALNPEYFYTTSELPESF